MPALFEAVMVNLSFYLYCRLAIISAMVIGIGGTDMIEYGGKSFEDKQWPDEIRERRKCFTTKLRNALAYDLNQNQVRTRLAHLKAANACL